MLPAGLQKYKTKCRKWTLKNIGYLQDKHTRYDLVTNNYNTYKCCVGHKCSTMICYFPSILNDDNQGIKTWFGNNTKANRLNQLFAMLPR